MYKNFLRYVLFFLFCCMCSAKIALLKRFVLFKWNWMRLTYLCITYLLIYLPTYLFTNLLTYLLTYLLIYLLTYLLTYLFTYLLIY